MKSLGMFVHLSVVVSAFLLLLIGPGGCATTGATMKPTAKVLLDTSVRIAVRHAVADSPRGAEKAAHIRAVVAKVQATTTAQSTVAFLETAVRAEVDKMHLSPLDTADANDLITLLGTALEASFQGPDADRVVQVKEFLQLVLSALPAA